MEFLVEYFSDIPSWQRSVIIVGGITFFWILEGFIPLFRLEYRKWRHAGTNFFFTLTTILVNLPLAFLLLRASDWAVAEGFGLLYVLPEEVPYLGGELPYWAYGLIGIMGLDFIGAYLAHWAEHKIKPFWMIHLVHHTDHYVDTTTANRHHPLESFIRYGFTLAGVVLVGAPIGMVLLYQSLSVLASQFNHANIGLPRGLDRLLSWVIVTPDMHKVHHHNVLPYTDSNYGNIFSIWDRIFGTFMSKDPDTLVYGVDTFPDERENASVWGLLKQPFHKYRRPTTDPEGGRR